jgi:peptide deformylase
MREGCLSFPGVRENIERPHSVFVQAFTPNGQPFETTLIDIEARIALHEIDHLNGITWLDHMGSMQKKIATKRAKKVKRGIEHDMKSEEMARRTRSRQSQGRRNSRSRFT